LWSSFADKCDPSVKVVLGNCGELTSERLDAVDDWCTENMFVYVDAEESVTNEEENPMDKVGIPLLLETLEANMWDGLVLKSSQSQVENNGNYTLLVN
jgi:hypothetical protein